LRHRFVPTINDGRLSDKAEGSGKKREQASQIQSLMSNHPTAIVTTIMATQPEAKAERKKSKEKVDDESETKGDGEVKKSQESLANKFCDHYSTHNCTNQVPANQSLCDNCAAGMC
jgi:hypothetical protein